MSAGMGSPKSSPATVASPAGGVGYADLMPDDTLEVAALSGVETRSPAQRRILEATHDLIAEHGVGGTSLQMIADAVGVTKAAVYHQFRAKDEIVIAVTEIE